MSRKIVKFASLWFFSMSLLFSVLLPVVRSAYFSEANGETVKSINTNIFTRTQSVAASAGFGVALGDLDHDGDLDAFVANALHESSPSNANKVWVNDGNGNFSDSGQSLGKLDSNAVALGDLDSDGDLDAFVGNTVTNTIWLNDGAGTFHDSGQQLGTNESHAVAFADVDSDGDLDVYVANNGQQNALWLNNGVGEFTLSSQDLGNLDSYSAAFGDLDGDCDVDLFVTNYSPSLANQVWLNDGNGRFTDTGQRLGNAQSYTAVLGDLDRDGDLDAYVANGNTDEIWLNNGDGTFQISPQSLDTDSGFGAALGDFDADGDLDLFLPIYSGGNGVHIWLNDGTGQFGEQIVIAEEDAANFFVALGDLDGNDTLDAFVTSINHTDGNGVWINQHVAGGDVRAINNSPLFPGISVVLSATHRVESDAAYHWDFGDGSSGDGAVVQHVYARCGVYTAVVTTTNLLQQETGTTIVIIAAPESLFLPLVLR